MRKGLKKIFKNKQRILIILVVLVVIGIYVFLGSFLDMLNEKGSVFTIVRDRVAEEENVQGIFLRDEKILGEDSKGRIDKIKKEGEKCAKSDGIFRYYSPTEEKIVDKINEINEKIDKVIAKKNINVSTPENAVIDAHIESILLELSNISNQNKINEFVKTIQNESLKKAKLSGELSKEGTEAKRLIDEKNVLENRLKENTKIIQAPMSGVVSYNIDGMETKLKTDNFEYLTPDFVKKLNIKDGVTITPSTTNGKIVNNFFMYVLVYSDSENAKNAKVGDNIKIRFRENVSPAQIVDIKKFGKKNQIVFRITANVEKLLDKRSLNVELIWWEEVGLKIANRALIKENDFNYVILNKWGYTEKIIIKVLKETENYSIVTNYTTEEREKLGVDISKNRPTIKLYDEVIIP